MGYTIDEIKDITIPIAKAFGIGRMSLFGSHARGEAKDDSDVDIAIVIKKEMDSQKKAFY